ncbi:MAG: hypothetical protein RBT78_04085 [Kiritimatiellia bacterium]|jgi:hypothetical protein|nr:hypothetical protein [Kiritimatiellia bacterium]
MLRTMRDTGLQRETRKSGRRLLREASLLLLFAPCAAPASDPAVAEWSDGAARAGEVRVIGSRPLTLVPLGESVPRRYPLEDLLRIEQQTETAGMERPWVFKEAGRPEKVRLEGAYPLLNFRTCLTLSNGSMVTGHVISLALTLDTGNGREKIFLQRQIRGAKGQRLEDVAYLRSLRLLDRAPAAGGGTLRGRVAGCGPLLSVTALDTRREGVLAARLTAPDRFDFGTLLPGEYDVCVLTATHALFGLSDAVPPGARGEPVQAGDLEAVRRVFPLADDFFNDRWVLALRGNRACASALVYKRRADYYEAERWTPGGFLWHLEVWRWHRAGDEWKVDRRHILIRHKQKGGEANRLLVASPLLEAVRPGNDLDLRFDGEKRDVWRAVRDLN